MKNKPSIYEGNSMFRRRFALLSGGDHSIVATEYAAEEGSIDEVVHVRTGIGVKECEEFVVDLCDRKGWPLRIVEPPELTYEELVLKFGFPGPGLHHIPYRYLKERAIRALVREAKRDRLDEIALITGVHQQESARRMGFTLPRIKVGSQIWLAPLFNYNALDFADYKRKHSLPSNPVKKTLGFSGECLCGAFAQPEELKKIERFHPDVAAKIHVLQDKARLAGKHCQWGVRPPKARNRNQYEIPFQPMCVNCHANPQQVEISG